MINPLSSAPVPTPTGLTAGLTGSNATLGKEDFLKLLVAQLQNQDPLDPSAPEEFAAQLAQFSSLEQLVNVNNNLEAQIGSNQAVADAVAASGALNLAGREVLVAGDALVLDGTGESAPLTVGVASPGGEAVLTIVDESGTTVQEVSLGQIGGGRQTIPVSEHVSGLEAGRYRYEVTVLSEDGAPVEVQPFYRMRVEGVRFGPNGPQVTDGVEEYSIGDVVEIISGL